MDRKKDRYFVQESDLQKAWEEYRISGEVSDHFAYMVLEIAEHLLQHRNFIGYSCWMKEEMKQEAYLKCHKNMKNYRPEKGTLFSYLTTGCWCAFLNYLKQHYRIVNKQRRLLLDALEGQEISGNPTTAELTERIRRQIQEIDDHISRTKDNDEEESIS